MTELKKETKQTFSIPEKQTHYTAEFLHSPREAKTKQNKRLKARIQDSECTARSKLFSL